MPDIAGVPSPVERLIANPPPKTGADHEKRDLAAQEASALWAFWMAMITLFSAGVTIVGTILLYQQIILTREAVTDTGKATEAMRDANRISANVQRPWIEITTQLLTFTHPSERAFTVECMVKFKNSGHMVAENFQALVKIVPMNERFLDKQESWFDKFEREVEPRDTVLIPNETYGYVVQSSNAIDWLPWSEKEGARKDCYLMVLAMVRYRIPSDEKWRFAMKSFSIGENNGHIDNRHLVYDTIRKLDFNKIKIQPLGRSRAT